MCEQQLRSTVHFICLCAPARRVLNNNELDKIKADGLFEKLPELQHLDLRKNKISRIEASAFQGAHNLTDL
jgi:slit protein 2